MKTNLQQIEFIDDDKNIKLTVYSYKNNNICYEYFIGIEIASLLGYTKTTQAILNNVSKCNQLVFREYHGVKEPKLNPKTILISRDGVNEIIDKTKKSIPQDTLNILKMYNITKKFSVKEQIIPKKIEIEFIVEDDNDKNIKLTVYSYESNNICYEYFIGIEIASLLGYNNTTQAILNNVSKYNKIAFRDYHGIKEPKSNPKTILISRDGINEIIDKTKKSISSDVSYVLKKHGVDINRKSLNIQKKHEDDVNKVEDVEDVEFIIEDEDDVEDDVNEDVEFIIEDEDDVDVVKDVVKDDVKNDIEQDSDELTMYSYISNHLCFEYFVGYEIAALLGYANTGKVILNNVSKCNQLVFRDYPCVKEPKLDPRIILITRDGAVELLIKTRKRISPDVSHILKKFNIDMTNRKCLTKEQQTLSALTNAFKTEKFEDQFKVGKYYLDLYFTEYKIVVECDENGHADRKPYKERERMDFVNKTFEIDDSNWIRYNPDENDFDISKVIGRIYRYISSFKENTNEQQKLQLQQQLQDKVVVIKNCESIVDKNIEKLIPVYLDQRNYQITNFSAAKNERWCNGFCQSFKKNEEFYKRNKHISTICIMCENMFDLAEIQIKRAMCYH